MSEVSPQLEALSPLDGRYHQQTCALRKCFSECATIQYRTRAELSWLIFLDNCLPRTQWIPQDRIDDILKIGTMSAADFNRVKEIERTTRHDTKSVEYYIQEKLKELKLPKSVSPLLHFGCTSEDINNVALAFQIRDSVNNVIKPTIKKILESMYKFSQSYANIPLMARTHGQPATPTTYGKEVAVFHQRISRHLLQISSVKYFAKFSGAVGCFNAHVVAYPEVDWFKQCKAFIESHGLCYEDLSTQIECHDYIAELSDAISRLNTTLVGFSRDMWMYISRDLLRLRVVKDEVGSSTMPHKINPIDFENAEGNLGIANAMLNFFSSKLPISRLQRDLSDSTVLRNIGSSFGYCMIAYSSILKGLDKIYPDSQVALDELRNNCELLAEPIQTILRAKGAENAYERLKSLTRGKKVTLDDLHQAIHSFEELTIEEKKRLCELTPETYLGLSEKLAKSINENEEL